MPSWHRWCVSSASRALLASQKGDARTPSAKIPNSAGAINKIEVMCDKTRKSLL